MKQRETEATRKREEEVREEREERREIETIGIKKNSLILLLQCQNFWHLKTLV